MVFLLYEFYAKFILILAFFIIFSMCFDLLSLSLQPEIILLERDLQYAKERRRLKHGGIMQLLSADSIYARQ